MESMIFNINLDYLLEIWYSKSWVLEAYKNKKNSLIQSSNTKLEQNELYAYIV